MLVQLKIDVLLTGFNNPGTKVQQDGDRLQGKFKSDLSGPGTSKVGILFAIHPLSFVT